ncbi:MAG: hypothetical protein Q9161_006435 [Pseudevernia consocians]
MTGNLQFAVMPSAVVPLRRRPGIVIWHAQAIPQKYAEDGYVPSSWYRCKANHYEFFRIFVFHGLIFNRSIFGGSLFSNISRNVSHSNADDLVSVVLCYYKDFFDHFYYEDFISDSISAINRIIYVTIVD